MICGKVYVYYANWGFCGTYLTVKSTICAHQQISAASHELSRPLSPWWPVPSNAWCSCHVLVVYQSVSVWKLPQAWAVPPTACVNTWGSWGCWWVRGSKNVTASLTCSSHDGADYMQQSVYLHLSDRAEWLRLQKHMRVNVNDRWWISLWWVTVCISLAVASCR